MQNASVSVLKARLSEYLDKVKNGAEVFITDHGRPVAKLIPVGKGKKGLDPNIAELVRAGIVKPGKGKLPRSLLRRSPAKDPKGLVLKALLEERSRERNF